LPKVYLDVDALSYASGLPRDEVWKTDVIRNVLELARQDKIQIVVSMAAVEVSITESGAPREMTELYLTAFRRFLGTIPYGSIEVDVERAIGLARIYFEGKVIMKYENAVHIAMACLAEANYFLTWNEEHLLKKKVMVKLSTLNRKLGIKTPRIIRPEDFKV